MTFAPRCISLLTVLMIPTFALGIDVQLNVVNHLDKEVMAYSDQGSTKHIIPSNGSLITETVDGTNWTFSSGDETLKQYSVTTEQLQEVVLGKRRTLERQFINKTSSNIDVVAIVPSKNEPSKTALAKLATLAPNTSKSWPLYPGTKIVFMQDKKAIEAVYTVFDDGQKATHEIRVPVKRTIHNFSESAAQITETTASNERLPSTSVSARRQKTISVSVGSQLSFDADKTSLREPYLVSEEPSGDIRLGVSDSVKDSSVSKVDEAGNDAQDDIEWLNWVDETGSDFLTKTGAGFDRKEPPTVGKYSTSTQLWGRQFPPFLHSAQGYNAHKMDPRKPGLNKGTRLKDELIFPVLEPGATNWYSDQKGGTGKVLPTYLRLRKTPESESHRQTHVYASEAEHKNSWSVSVSTPGSAGGSFDFSHESKTGAGSSKLTSEKFTVDWEVWAALNKDQLILDKGFARRLQELEGAGQNEFFAFFDDIGTHYPVASLFGYRTYGEQTATTSSLVASTSNSWGVGLNVGVKAGGGTSDSSSQKTTDDIEEDRTYGKPAEDSWLPVHVVLAPMSELIWPQLVDLKDHQAMREEMNRQYDAYKKQFETSDDAEHRLFKVTAKAYLHSSDDWAESFDSYKSWAALHLMDISNTPANVSPFPQVFFNQTGSDETTETKKGTEICKTEKYVAVNSQSSLVGFKFFASFFIQDYDKSSSADFRNQSLPDGLRLWKMGQTLEEADLPKLKTGGIKLTDVVSLRRVLDEISILSQGNAEVRRIEERDFSAPGEKKDWMSHLDISAAEVSSRIKEATKNGLPEYVKLLEEVNRLTPLCEHFENHLTAGLGRVFYTMKIEDVTHPAEIKINFPVPPLNSVK